MRKALVLVVTCLLSLAYTFSQATSSEQEKKNTNVVVEWRNGLTIQSADNSFRMQVGGKLHNDWAFQEGDQQITGLLGELEDGTEFRRARLSMSGLMYEWVEFKMQVDFATGDLFFRDVYAGLRDLRGIGNIRIGQFKEPFGLEEQTSASYIPFMERSLANALVPSRNTGVMIHNRQFNERASWAVGVFKDTDDFGAGTSDEDYAITGRVTGLPWFENEGRRLLHLGVAYSRRNTADFARFQQRPEAHLSPRFVDTGLVPAEAVDLLGTELALVHGPASLQGEYILADTDGGPGREPSFKGFYLQGSCFLTGENRNYNASEATLDRVQPRKSFLSREGLGAWEIALRLSKIDLNNEAVRGGELMNWTLGLNWYLSSFSRIMWNYVRADLHETGNADIFQMRFQIDF